MRILDVNTMIGAPGKVWRFTDEKSLVAYLDDYRIEEAVCCHAIANRDPEEGNARMLAVARASGGRICACMQLEPSLDTLGLPGKGSARERLEAARPAAARVLQGEAAHYWMDKFYAQDLLRPLEEMHMPLLIDGGYSPWFLHALPEMAAAFPHVPMILLRYGLNESRSIYPLLKYTRNVYFDMSTMLDCGGVEEICEKFGSERLLFGSGLPHFVPSGALALLMYTGISEADRENIAHANFERLEGGILR